MLVIDWTDSASGIRKVETLAFTKGSPVAEYAALLSNGTGSAVHSVWFVPGTENGVR